jgi:hypothetical protein
MNAMCIRLMREAGGRRGPWLMRNYTYRFLGVVGFRDGCRFCDAHMPQYGLPVTTPKRKT